MAGLWKARKTRLRGMEGQGDIRLDGFPGPSHSPLEIACGDSHIPTATTTTIPGGHFYRAKDGDASIES